jgi:hypothetical protein
MISVPLVCSFRGQKRHIKTIKSIGIWGRGKGSFFEKKLRKKLFESGPGALGRPRPLPK